MTWMFTDATAIGIGETEYTKRGGAAHTEMELACEAIAVRSPTPA